MQLEPECIGCLFDQVLRAFKLLDTSITRDQIITAQKKLMKKLIKVDINKNASPIIGKMAYGIVAETLGIKDPYTQLKKEQNSLALKFYDEAKKIVDDANDPLFEALIIAALGNTIDLAAQHKIDFINDIKKFNPENLVVNDYEFFKNSIKIAENLLILGDNCGEIVFDKLLVSTIKDEYPNLNIVYSVRSAPIINDVTLDDAKFISLSELVPIVEASPTPGIDLSTSSEEFKRIFFLKGGIILSKGQGNFESLYQMEIPDKHVYYLLKAKCNLMERIFNVKNGDLIFKRKTIEF
ncbi:MAG: DUF89 domain-containing protein [Candidatus Heimdallarchaeota archaeon]